MKNRIRLLAATATVAISSLAVQAHAQLLNVVQSFPDTTATTNPYLIYDHDAVNSTTGLLRIVAGSATLNEGSAAGGSNAVQSYFGAGDSIPDVLFSIQVRNGTGGFTAGSFVSGVVSIGFGNSTTANRWKWDGTVTALGSQIGAAGTIVDATWTMTGDQYQNMPGNMNQFVNGLLTGQSGGIKVQSSAALSATANFSNDWVYGPTPTVNANLNNFRIGMTSPNQVNSTITSDIFVSAVPEPETTLMMLIGLGLLVPLARMRKQTEH